MKRLMYLVWSMAILLILSNCGKKGNSGGDNTKADEYYTCPMHPTVRSKKAGACPICNMSLIKVSSKKATGKDKGFRLTAQQRQIANIEVQEAQSAGLSTGATLTGEIVLNENAVEVISSRLPGRIDRLYSRTEGEQVRKGQPLYELYSEQLAAAQQQYLLASRQDGAKLGEIGQGFLAAARQKLLLWGMTETQINQLVRSGKPSPRFTFNSPVSGTLIEAPVQEGSYVQEGSVLFRLSDLSTVWMQAQLYPQEMAQVTGKATVRIVTEADLTDTLNAVLVQQNPVLEQTRQQNLATFQVANPKRRLRPGMMAYVLVKSQTEQGVVIPRSALIPGDMPTAWVETADGSFQARMLKLGSEVKDQVTVLNGIKAGEKVVINGVYLLNSEYVLRKGAGTAHQH